MPITITPATTTHPHSVALANSLGYPISARVTVTTCSGKVIRSGKTITLQSGQTAQSGPTRNHVLITWNVQRVQQEKGAIQTTAALTSRQGCPTAKAAKALAPSTKGSPAAGVTVTQPHSAGFPVIPALVAGLGLLLLIVLAARATRRVSRGHGGAHR